MKELIPVVSALVSGLFTFISGVFLWKMKKNFDESNRKATIIEKKMEEKKQLYLDVHKIMDRTIHEITTRQRVSTLDEFHSVSAKVSLIAPGHISILYIECCQLLDNWSVLYERSLPKQIEVGNYKTTLIQAPDPTVKFKKPANDAFEELQRNLMKLIDKMREDLN